MEETQLEEFRALTAVEPNLGTSYSPSVCWPAGEMPAVVILPHVLREVLAKQRFPYLGKAFRSCQRIELIRIVHPPANPVHERS